MSEGFGGLLIGQLFTSGYQRNSTLALIGTPPASFSNLTSRRGLLRVFGSFGLPGVIEIVSGRSFQRLTAPRILSVSGMKSSGRELPPSTWGSMPPTGPLPFTNALIFWSRLTSPPVRVVSLPADVSTALTAPRNALAVLVPPKPCCLYCWGIATSTEPFSAPVMYCRDCTLTLAVWRTHLNPA